MFEGNGVDIVLRLRELRRSLGLQQRDVALLSGIGEKSISSFESGSRTDAMKIGQLRKLLQVYGVTESEFFCEEFESRLGIGEDATPEGAQPFWQQMRELPDAVRDGLLDKFRLMVDTARDVQTLSHPVAYSSHGKDWELLNSRN
ncbi:MAG: helix-turn-helix domain-containing protein [Thermoanaerobaculia bacterium]